MKAALAAAAIAAGLAPTPAGACSFRHTSLFEAYDRATTVAHVEVAIVPGPRPGSRNRLGAGRVHLAVKRIVKGDPKARRLVTFETNTSCHIGFARGKDALVFLADDGDLATPEGYVEDHARWDATIDAWAAAASNVARRRVLVDAIVHGDDAVARDAAYFLADAVDLLVALDADQRAELAAVTPPKHSALPLVLARLAGGAFERERDASKLAAAIDGGTGEHDPARIAALERCERVHGKRLYPFTAYRRGVAAQFWKQLAQACRTGTRIR